MNAYSEELPDPPLGLPRFRQAPDPGRHITERQLAAIVRAADTGYLSPAAVKVMVAEIRYLRAELDLLQAIEPADEPSYPDGAVLTDRRGVRWTYSEPSDVWRLTESGLAVHRSARSYRQLAREFGPLRADGVPEGPAETGDHCDCKAAYSWGATGVMPEGHHWQTTHDGGYLAHDPGYRTLEEDGPVPDPEN